MATSWPCKLRVSLQNHPGIINRQTCRFIISNKNGSFRVVSHYFADRTSCKRQVAKFMARIQSSNYFYDKEYTSK